MTKHTQRIIRLSNLQFGIAGAIGLAFLAFVVWPAYSDFVDATSRITELTSSIGTYEKNLTDERGAYRELKENYLLSAANQRELSHEVLPTDLTATNIVRAVEAYTIGAADSHNPVLLKSINFGRKVEQKEVDYVTLPFKVTINTTREKLKDILRFFERSGTFMEPGTEVTRRLLDVREIAIQMNDLAVIQNQAEGGSVDIDLSVQSYALPATEKPVKKTATTEASVPTENK